jgi:hypothetical protein
MISWLAATIAGCVSDPRTGSGEAILPPDWGLGPAACVEAGAKRWDLLCPTATAPWTDSRIRFDAALLRDGDERPTRP